MTHVLLALVLGVTCSHLGGIAHAADQTILGNQLLVKDPGAPEKRKIVGKAKEKGSPNTLVGDPTVTGAFLGVRATGANLTEQLFALPQGTSAITGKPFWTGDATKGFKYKDSKGENGPIKLVQIKKSGGGVFTIKFNAIGKLGTISVLPPDPGDGGCFVVLIDGGDSYSVRFLPGDGKITNKGATLFKVSKPTLEGSCLPDPTTTTTSTSTTTTSSTSTSSSSTTSTSTSTTTSTTATTIFAGPAFPPFGGSADFAFVGNSQNPGGADLSLFDFAPDTWTALYWGPWSGALPAATLDGSLDTLSSFGGITGGDTIATWDGLTSWTDPSDMTVYPNVPIRCTVTVTAGGVTFVDSTTIPGLDPGPGSGISAVVDVAPGGTALDFTVKIEFTADIPTDGAGNYVALSTIPQIGGGLTQSSFSGAFYSQM